MKISREKTEVLEFGLGNWVGNVGSDPGIKLRGQILNRVEKFEYFVSIVRENGKIVKNIAGIIRNFV